MSEIERVRAAIERCELKRDAAGDASSRWYFEQCLAGWRAELVRLAAGPS